MDNKIVGVIGGDMRQLICAGELFSNGYFTRIFGIDIYNSLSVGGEFCGSLSEALNNVGSVLLPLPCSTDGVNVKTPFYKGEIKISDVFSHLRPGTRVLGGMIPEQILKLSSSYGIVITDYYKNEELTVSNTVPTAEGALEIAMREIPVTVNGMKCVVTGYGNVGQTMAKTLVALGADCTVAARRPEALARAKINGCKVSFLNNLPFAVRDAECLFNTVPSQIITKEVLENMKKDALIIDLASEPGGVDTRSADALGIKTVLALSLPGKCSPVSAGRLLGQTVMNIINNQEIFI